jgi:hypothetical protein
VVSCLKKTTTALQNNHRKHHKPLTTNCILGHASRFLLSEVGVVCQRCIDLNLIENPGGVIGSHCGEKSNKIHLGLDA